MKVYLDLGDDRQLIGRADVPADVGAVWEVPLFGPASIIKEIFTIGTITHLDKGANLPRVERVVILSENQRPELLPGWSALSS